MDRGGRFQRLRGGRVANDLDPNPPPDGIGMGPLPAPCAAHVQCITRFEAIVASSLLGGTSHSRNVTVTHAVWRGGKQRTAVPILGAGCRSAAAGMPMSDRAAGTVPPAAQAAVVVAAAARAAAQGTGTLRRPRPCRQPSGRGAPPPLPPPPPPLPAAKPRHAGRCRRGPLRRSRRGGEA